MSVHPYRQTDPETVLPEYQRLRRLISQYAPRAKKCRSSPANGATRRGGRTSTKSGQAKYLARQWLTNVYAEVPVSIWYDWHDDGRDPKEPEHHFGTVHNESVRVANRSTTQAVVPRRESAHRPAGGYRYNKRLAVGDPASDFVLLFDKGGREGDLKDLRLAVWTRRRSAPAGNPRQPGRSTSSITWAARADLAADEKGLLTVTATDAPLYLTPAAQRPAPPGGGRRACRPGHLPARRA